VSDFRPHASDGKLRRSKVPQAVKAFFADCSATSILVSAARYPRRDFGSFHQALEAHA